ncbi:hypothetical protein SLEP1_g35217 [Rubroshorea leprosula]|uniref:protein-serine/threonine phosphatase n=1 Tax=Rubroshorea leprosula TaxID=152421 RepID=A0AAV5KMI4_9ROSI|nr:hypothetical protein SLEP1_g35217 [Rubroshorea leprosula]
MHPWLRAQMVLSCWELVGRILGTSKDDVSDDDDPDDSSLHSPLFWSRDLEKHPYGEFSFAVIKGNEVIEDHSQVETGREATFVGVYDGHGGPDASRYISRRLFRNFIISYFVFAHGWYKASRTIGDAYMKEPEYNADPRFRRYYLPLPEPFQRPLLTPEPSLHRRVLQPSDGFVIFASDGLWENLTNQQAVDIVNKHQRAGIARKLIKRALKEAAKKRQMNFDELLRVPDATRRNFHDDITVVVIFVDHDLLEKGASVPELSVRGFGEVKVCHPM